MKSKSGLANGDESPGLGVCSALVSMNNFYYTVSFSVVSHLFCKPANSLDVISQHETASLKFGGKQTHMDFSNLSDGVYKTKIIATKSKHSNKEDSEFIQK